MINCVGKKVGVAGSHIICVGLLKFGRGIAAAVIAINK